MTIEDLVRDSLARRAPTAPADDAAYAGIERAITRRRRRRAVTQVVAFAAVGLAGFGVGALVVADDDPPSYSTRPEATGTPTPDDRPDAGTGSPTTTSTTAGPGEQVVFGPVSFVLPGGWSIVSQSDDDMCVAAAGTEEAAAAEEAAGSAAAPSSEEVEACAGVRITLGPLTGHEGGPYVEHGDWTWHTSTDPMPCPAPPVDSDAPFDAVVAGDDGMAPIDQGFRPVGDRTAVYDQWAATCAESGVEFTPRAWHLPTTQVRFLDLLGAPETPALLASVEFTADATDDGA